MHFRQIVSCGLLSLLLEIVATGFARETTSEVQFRDIEFGVDYYAEDYPPERTETDARLMEQAGFRTVRLADTNWQRLEPEEGRYDFSWLDRVLEILQRHGIRAILGTSTYVPPAWLIEKHPEFYSVNKDGVRVRWGGMGFMCLNHPLYRQYVERLVTALASHYGDHANVIGWQLDNELGTWGYACYDTDYCVPAFQRYLQQKFSSVEELNRRWLTVSYGHAYNSWKQLPLNWTLGNQAHQAPLELEAQRFFSSNVTSFLEFQAQMLRRRVHGQFLTHNLTGPSREGNPFQLAKPLNFLSWDSYPRIGEHVLRSLTGDLVRGFNRGGTFLMLEHRVGYMGPFSLSDFAPPPGLIRLWGWQTIAHGADGILFFRWRTSIGGSEQYWQGLLNYDGTPGRSFPEISRMGGELKRVGKEIANARTQSEVAELVSYDSLWALHVGNTSFPYFEQLNAFHHAFKQLGLNVDTVGPESDFSRYKVLVAPSLHVVGERLASQLEQFVRDGGTLVLSARSGSKTEDNLASQQPLPGPLSSLAKMNISNYTIFQEPRRVTWFGFDVDQGDYSGLAENLIQPVSPDWPGVYKARVWADVLEPMGAEVLFRYQKDYYAGKAAVTMAQFGKGRAIYVGTLLEPRFYRDLAMRVCRWHRIPTLLIPEGMDFSIREGESGRFWFVMNFKPVAQSLPLQGTYQDVLSEKVFTDGIMVPALDLRILMSKEVPRVLRAESQPGRGHK